MPDPVFTPLAAFGLAMTILNFLLNTIKSLYEKGFEIHDFDSIIQTYINTIRSCRAKYTTWKDIWDEKYHLRVLGVDGSREVNECMSSVEKLIAETVKSLRLDAPTARQPEVTSQSSSRSILGIFKRAWNKLKKSHRSKHKSVSAHPNQD